VRDNTSVCPMVSDTKFKGMLRKNVVSHWMELSVLSQKESNHHVTHLSDIVGIPQPV
jgi:hypothetical protein